MRSLSNFLICAIFVSQPLFGLYSQTDSSKTSLKITTFLDVFYSYDVAKPTSDFKQPYYFNHNRQNQVALNLGFIQLELLNARFRSKLGIQGGTYVTDNYKAEPSALRYFSEASAGLHLSKKKNLWLDAGIFPSHIGFESAISYDNLNLTRSLIAENSPYYECGAKLFYSPSSKWEFTAMVLNGWQRIQRLKNNSLLSLGTQITYTNSKVKVNYSTFIGTDSPDATRKIRFFNNLYAQFNPGKKWKFILGADFGMEQSSKNSNTYNFWYGAALISRYELNSSLSLNGRLEIYDDPNQVIVSSFTTLGYDGYGGSLGIDWAINSFALWRFEARYITSKDELYQTNQGTTRNNCFFTTSVAIKFDSLIK